MTDEPFTTQRLLALRKVTRSIADHVRAELRDYLAALAPVFRPRVVLGSHVDGPPSETVKNADAAFKDFKALFQAVGFAKPFNLPQEEMRSPIEIVSSVVEATSVEYAHAIKSDRQSKTVTVTKPLQWILSYSGFGPRRLQELLADPNRNQNDVRACLVHYLALHQIAARQTGLAKLFAGLHFTLSAGRLPGCGELPITYLSCLTTVLPPDDVVLESTELSGRDVFEELVLENSLETWCDPLRDHVARLM
jgi:hypothetical protein